MAIKFVKENPLTIILAVLGGLVGSWAGAIVGGLLGLVLDNVFAKA